MREIVASLIALLVMLCVVTASFVSADEAQNNPLSAEAKAYLAEKKIIRVGVDENWPPFDYYSEKQGHQGISASYLKAALNKIGEDVTVEYVAGSWATILEKIKTGEIDMIACVAETEQRKAYISYTDPYVKLQAAIYIRKDDQTISNLNDLKGKRIAIPAGYYENEHIIALNPYIEMLRPDNLEQALQLLADKKIDALIGTVSVVNYLITKDFYVGIKPAFKLPDHKKGFGFGFAKSEPQLQAIFQDALSRLSVEKRDSIKSRWSGYFDDEIHVPIHLTTTEKEWLSKKSVIKMAFTDDWYPAFFIENTKFDGVAEHYLQLLKKITGLTIERVKVSSNKKAIDLLKQGKVDLIPASYFGNSDLLYTDGYMKGREFAFTKTRTVKPFRLQDVFHKQVSILHNNNSADIIKNENENAEIILVDSLKNGLLSIVNEEADIFIGDINATNYIAEKEGIVAFKADFAVDLAPKDIRMAISNKQPILFSVMQKVFYSVSEQEKKQLAKKWDSPEKKKQHSLDFTNTEKQWIEDNKVVTVAVDKTFAPISFIDRYGKHTGILSDYLKYISDATGIIFKPIFYDSFSEALNAFRQGKADIFDAIVYNAERSQYMDFSDEHLFLEYVIVVPDAKESIKYIGDLSGKKVGSLKGYTATKRLQQDVRGINSVEYITVDEGLKALSIGALDAFVIEIPILDYYTEKLNITNVRVTGSAPYSLAMHFGLDPEADELRSILNKVLKYMPVSEKKRMYRNWVKFEYESEIDYTLLWQVGGALLIMLLASLFWNSRLNKEIDERKRAQASLSELHMAMEYTPFMVALTDKQKKVEYVNRSLLILLKKSKQAILNKDIYSLLSDYLGSDLGKEVDQALESEEIFTREVSYPCDNNQLCWLSVVVAKVNVDGLENNYIWMMEDIAWRKKSEIELRAAKNEAERATVAKSEFLANMSHEIRTPMNSVIGFTEILDNLITDPVQRGYLNSIKIGGNALLGIINDILDLSKIEAGHLEIQNEATDLAALFIEMEQIFSAKLKEKNLELEVIIDIDFPSVVLFDGPRLRQVLLNIVGNAIKFTDKGGVMLKVGKLYNNTQRSSINMKIEVIDTGVGIPKKNLDTIFNSFEQQYGQSQKKYGGTGLGLSISQKLIEKMGGEILVESEVGKGSKFTICLENIVVTSIDKKLSLNNNDKKTYSFKGSKLLVVDDVFENRLLVDVIFKDTLIEVYQAADGEESLKMIEEVNPDLVLMDLRMPVMTGYQAVLEIRKTRSLQSLPVIALTASVITEDLERVADYGFNGYLRKPITQQQLYDELAKYLPHDIEDNNQGLVNDETFNSNDEKQACVMFLEALLPEWESIKDKGDMQLIERFNEKLLAYATEHSVKSLLKYAEGLKSSVEAFDLSLVYSRMNSFDEIATTISNAGVINE